MTKVKEICNDDMQVQIDKAKLKNEIIMKRLINVYGKFEELVSLEEGRGLMKAEHDALNEEIC